MNDQPGATSLPPQGPALRDGMLVISGKARRRSRRDRVQPECGNRQVWRVSFAVRPCRQMMQHGFGGLLIWHCLRMLPLLDATDTTPSAVYARVGAGIIALTALAVVTGLAIRAGDLVSHWASFMALVERMLG